MSKKRGGLGLKAVVIIIAVVLLLLLGFGMLFNVDEVTVEGAYQYTADEIIAASGISPGRNLFFVSTGKAEENIYAAFPYISSVSVTRELPGAVRITVKEGVVKAAIEFEGVLYMVDENCRVTGEVTSEDTYIKITGLTVTQVELGSVVTVDRENETRLFFTQQLLNRLGDDGFSHAVTWVDVSNISSITFDYLGRFVVNVGSGKDLEYKLSRLDGVVAQIADGETGRIDISEEGRTYFESSRDETSGDMSGQGEIIN